MLWWTYWHKYLEVKSRRLEGKAVDHTWRVKDEVFIFRKAWEKTRKNIPIFSVESSTLSYVPGCTSILWLTSPWHSSGIDLKVALDIPCRLKLTSAFHRWIFVPRAQWSEKKGCRQYKFHFCFGVAFFFSCYKCGVWISCDSGVGVFSEWIFGVVSFAALWVSGG
jgi:hypothetical protein